MSFPFERTTWCELMIITGLGSSPQIQQNFQISLQSSIIDRSRSTGISERDEGKNCFVTRKENNFPRLFNFSTIHSEKEKNQATLFILAQNEPFDETPECLVNGQRLDVNIAQHTAPHPMMMMILLSFRSPTPPHWHAHFRLIFSFAQRDWRAQKMVG